MPKQSIESAHLFTPGRASYVTQSPDGSFNLNLTEASARRAEVAAEVFDEEFHSRALFAGGYPGITQSWPEAHIPPIGSREADLAAIPLISRLTREGWSPEAIKARILKQGESNNSIGDVATSIERGLLSPDDFHSTVARHGIELVAGEMHGLRFRDILIKALDIDPSLIRRIPIRDIYGTPPTPFRKRELAPVAIAKELAAVALNRFVLKDVRPGNLEDLFEAEQRFNHIAVNSK